VPIGTVNRGGRAAKVLLDAHTRRVVGGAMTDHWRTTPAPDALALARHNRRPGAGLVHCTYRGGTPPLRVVHASPRARAPGVKRADERLG